jgi:hypothetical protein
VSDGTQLRVEQLQQEGEYLLPTDLLLADERCAETGEGGEGKGEELRRHGKGRGL